MQTFDFNPDFKQRLQKISTLLNKYSSFFSQWDMDVIVGKRFNHQWINKALKLSPNQLMKFDAERDYTQLECPEWHDLIKEIDILSSFPKRKASAPLIKTIGNLKKQHEFNKLYSLMQPLHIENAIDFGGGVGNLAYFMEHELGINMNILEKDSKLIMSGREKLAKLESRVSFTECHISNNTQKIPLDTSDLELAIGLHTCGNFATDMMRMCIKSDIPRIINFGCCYSKITNNDYNISTSSDKSLHLNQRALSCATLGFEKIPEEFYEYRKKIMKYKFSFYHWLYNEHKMNKFCPMSNARRNLYKNTFCDFVKINLTKFFPELTGPSSEKLEQFYHSHKNIELNNYLSVYYAISRYFGKLIESYLLCDRALFLEENNYTVEIQEVFDSKISPRNKGIIAQRLK